MCPANRPQRKGVVEKAIQYVTQSWWRSAPVSTPAQAQADLDRWCVAVSDRRRRGRSTVGELAATESLLSLPELPFPAEYREERVVSRDALVEFETNRYSVPPGHAGATVEVGPGSASCTWRSTRPRATGSRGIAARSPAQSRRSARPSTRACSSGRCSSSSPRSKRCPRKPNRPPGERAQGGGREAARRARRRRGGRRSRAVRADREGRWADERPKSISNCARTSPTSSSRRSPSSSPPRSRTPRQNKPATRGFCTTCSPSRSPPTEQRRLDGRLQLRELPAHKTLEQFDLERSPRSTGAWSRSSPRCGSSRRRPTCC